MLTAATSSSSRVSVLQAVPTCSTTKLDPQRAGVETSPRHAYHSGGDCTSSCSRLFEPGKRSSLDDQRLSSSALAKKPVSVHHHMHGFTRTLAHVPSNAKAASQCFTAERKLCASRRTLQQHKNAQAQHHAPVRLQHESRR